jgi:NAD-reducing hydrogenase small subunit
MKKVRLATVWLDGCAGCHMSILDIDEAIIGVAKRADVVYGPLVDAQEFPKAVDVTVVEGAISSQEDLEKIQMIRKRSKLLVALGDCAGQTREYPRKACPRCCGRPFRCTRW